MLAKRLTRNHSKKLNHNIITLSVFAATVIASSALIWYGSGKNTVSAISSISWTPVASAPSDKIDAGAAFLAGKLYVFSSYKNVHPLAYSNTINVYDPTANSWSVLKAHTPQGMANVATTSDGQYIYLAGPYTTDPNRPCGSFDPCEIFGMTNVYRFDPTKPDASKFSSLPNLPMARGSGDLALVGKKLHFFGGNNTGTIGSPPYGNDRLEQLDHWTLDLDNLAAGWVSDVPLPNGAGRTHAGSAVIGTSIYLLGGHTGLGEIACSKTHPYPCVTLTDSVLKFDTVRPDLGWQTMAPLPAPRSHTAQTTSVITTLTGPEIVIGGGDGPVDHPTNTVWLYTPDQGMGSWTASSQLLAARYTGVLKVDDVTGVLYNTGGIPGAISKNTDQGMVNQ